MAKRETPQEFKDRIYKKYEGKVEILSDYKGGSEPVDFVYHCERHGDVFKTMNAKNISSNKTFQPCKECMREDKRKVNRTKTELYNEFVEYIESKGGKLLEDKWVKSKYYYTIQCDNPNHPPFKMTHDSIMNSKQTWCPHCSGRLADFQKIYSDICVESDGELISEYISAYKYVKVVCNKDNWEWDVLPLNLIKGRWCPICGLPESERVIYDILKEFNINFDIQYTFSNLKSDCGELLKFDFALLNNKNFLMGIIESDGDDHRHRHGDSIRAREKQRLQDHDIIKNEYCRINKIPIIRIPFYNYKWGYSEYREDILNNWIDKIKEVIK